MGSAFLLWSSFRSLIRPQWPCLLTQEWRWEGRAWLIECLATRWGISQSFSRPVSCCKHLPLPLPLTLGYFQMKLQKVECQFRLIFCGCLFFLLFHPPPYMPLLVCECTWEAWGCGGQKPKSHGFSDCSPLYLSEQSLLLFHQFWWA